MTDKEIKEMFKDFPRFRKEWEKITSNDIESQRKTEEEMYRYRKLQEMEERKANLPEPEFTKAKRAERTSEVTSEATSEINELDRAALEYHRKVMEYEFKTGLQLANMTSFKDGIEWLSRKIIEVIDALGDNNTDKIANIEALCIALIEQNKRIKED